MLIDNQWNVKVLTRLCLKQTVYDGYRAPLLKFSPSKKEHYYFSGYLFHKINLITLDSVVNILSIQMELRFIQKLD